MQPRLTALALLLLLAGAAAPCSFALDARRAPPLGRLRFLQTSLSTGAEAELEAGAQAHSVDFSKAAEDVKEAPALWDNAHAANADGQAKAAAATIVACAAHFSTYLQANNYHLLPARDPAVKLGAMALDHLAFQSGTAATLHGCRMSPLNDIDTWTLHDMSGPDGLVLRLEKDNHDKNRVWYTGSDPRDESTAKPAGGVYAGSNEMDVWTPLANEEKPQGMEQTFRTHMRNALAANQVESLPFTVAGNPAHLRVLFCSDLVRMKFDQASTVNRQFYGRSWKKVLQDVSDIACLCGRPQCNPPAPVGNNAPSLARTAYNDNDIATICAPGNGKPNIWFNIFDAVRDAWQRAYNHNHNLVVNKKSHPVPIQQFDAALGRMWPTPKVAKRA
jgi:hypothetical protein